MSQNNNIWKYEVKYKQIRLTFSLETWQGFYFYLVWNENKFRNVSVLCVFRAKNAFLITTFNIHLLLLPGINIKPQTA